MSVNHLIRVLFCTVPAIIAGCGGNEDEYGKSAPASAPRTILFRDSVESNTEISADEKFDFQFVDRFGNSVDLKELRGTKNIVLVVTRGFSGSYGGDFCPLCTAQTSRLIRKHEEFDNRNAELLVVFPGSEELANSFVEQLPGVTRKSAKSIPFSIVLDEELAFVDRLMIRGDLAKPSTYILDKAGKLRFAYVGTTPSDRPSLKAMLDQLDRIEQE